MSAEVASALCSRAPALLVMRAAQAVVLWQSWNVAGPGAQRSGASSQHPGPAVPAGCGGSPKRPAFAYRKKVQATLSYLLCPFERARIGANSPGALAFAQVVRHTH